MPILFTNPPMLISHFARHKSEPNKWKFNSKNNSHASQQHIEINYSIFEYF